jgi:hypothetical protein
MIGATAAFFGVSFAESGHEQKAVRIQFARMVRLTLWGTELQTLRPGEYYDVSPVIGRVLVGDGWANEVTTETHELWSQDSRPGEDSPRRVTGS